MGVLELIKIIIIGITEGVAEWLPISSTGHMILVFELIKPNVSDEFLEMFLVVIQLGAIAAIPTLYFDRIIPCLKGKCLAQKRDVYQLWQRIAIASFPAVAVGFFVELVDLNEWLNSYITVAISLILYGVAFVALPKIISGRMTKPTKITIDNKDAFLLGMFQMLSIVPGTSRSGATMLGGMIIGKDAVVSTEFSFFMAIPVMLGASLLKIFKFFLSGSVLTAYECVYLAVGMLISYLVSIVSIRFLLNVVRRRGLLPFGIYRILLGIAVILVLAIKKCG